MKVLWGLICQRLVFASDYNLLRELNQKFSFAEEIKCLIEGSSMLPLPPDLEFITLGGATADPFEEENNWAEVIIPSALFNEIEVSDRYESGSRTASEVRNKEEGIEGS
ncbi:hypothetical protein O181_000002 [Austropuccinia psidii MF-1]|uniref:Uncharacterized protein n=1 Tax=Austropuccinia psidii MF-1 TaxID=1389203 RepID=A0A9Q3GBJ9_9BASI|nr:hypothetical protein [Austropuccinia psidii MF-1]